MRCRLGIASGLPFAVITGTLNAWFTKYEIAIATIGVFAWSGLAYSFKFLWSPALHRTAAPFFSKMGLRRSWFIPIQCAIALCFLGFSLMNPADHFGLIALLAVVAAFLSATFDIVVDAWRIETANSPDDLDTLTTFYQGGYRSAAFIGGAGALILSDAIGWNITLAILGVVMAITIYAAILAPEPPRPEDRVDAKIVTPMIGTFTQGWRNLVLLIVVLGWAWAFATLGWFMYAAISSPETAKAGEFTANLGWLIVLWERLNPFGPTLPGLSLFILALLTPGVSFYTAMVIDRRRGTAPPAPATEWWRWLLPVLSLVLIALMAARA